MRSHAASRIHAAASAAGRPAPRIVAELPVYDDVAEARAAVEATAVACAGMPSYQRILAIGGADHPAEAAIVGNETSVCAQLQGLIDVGATDVWVNIVPVGDIREARAVSARRTNDLLRELLDEA